MNKFFLILLTSAVNGSSFWQLFDSPTTQSAQKNNNLPFNSGTLRRNLYSYERKYLNVPFNNANQKSLIGTEKHMDDVAFAIKCSMMKVGDSGSECPKDRFIAQNRYVKIIKSNKLIIVSFSPVIDVHHGGEYDVGGKSYWKHVIDIYIRAEKVFCGFETRMNKFKRIVFTGRGSGGSIASLLAWRFCFEERKVMIITLDELPVYTLNMRMHPIGSKAYLRFTTDILYQKFSETDDFYWPKGSEIIDLCFVGLYDDNFGTNLDGFSLESYLPKKRHSIRSERERQDLKNKIIQNIKQAVSACKLIPQAYKYKKSLEISEITQLAQDHIEEKINLLVTCQLRDGTISCQERESSIILFEFLFKISKKEEGGIERTCNKLIKEAQGLKPVQLLEKNIKKCFLDLFDQRNDTLLYFRNGKNPMCHLAEGSNKFLYLIPIAGLEKLYLLYRNAPLTFFSLTSYKYMNFPIKECKNILEPVFSKWDDTTIELRKLASSFLINPSAFDITNSFNSNGASYHHSEIADCLSRIDSYPALDCSLDVNHWMGYCPKVCEDKNSALFCQKLIVCPKHFYLSVSSTGFLYNNLVAIRDMHKNWANNKTGISYWLYEISSLYERYSWIFSQFYLLVLREEH